MVTVREFAGKIKIAGKIAFDEPMSLHTTFKIGGNADAFIVPETLTDAQTVLEGARSAGIDVVFLGEGANILVGDSGFRGIILATSRLAAINVTGNTIIAEAGVKISTLCETAALRSLSGLEFIYGMPGSVGGSLFMNARCYDHSISDLLAWAETLSPDGTVARHPYNPSEWDYKKSPFQSQKAMLIRAEFSPFPGDVSRIRSSMDEKKRDRTEKGHYLFPCAGSIFKNNRKFGEPAGKLIDRLGLRGFAIGNAQISDFHANIFINRGGATARDMRSLIAHTQECVKKAYGFELEPELIFIGEF